MNPFSLSGLALSFICTFLVFVILKSARSKLHYVWALFNISVAMWGLGSFFMRKEVDFYVALFWIRFAHVGVIFLAVFFFHVVYLVCRISNRLLLLFTYYQGVFFAIMAWSNVFISSKNIEIIYNSFYYDKAHGFFYPAFFSIWLGLMLYGHIKLFTTYLRVTGFRKTQILYFLFAMIVGFSGGLTNFFPVFNIPIYPIGNFTISLYCLIITYATLRYRLMDISIVITRTGIFVAVYSIVLGIPFFLAFGWQEKLINWLGSGIWWMAPLVTSTVLATAGPFLYLYIQRRAEEKLFEDQRRYQATLRQAATGMGRIKDMDKLVGLIVHIVTRSVRIEHSVLFLKEPGGKKYVLEGARSRQEANWSIKDVDGKSPLVRMINKVRQPLVYAELHQQSVDNPGLKLDGAVKQMEDLKAELVVPSFIDENLIAFMVLGRKISRELYTSDDIAVFSILASQAALAIENCQFYKDMRATHEQLFQAEKMATIGIMADGLSHQINNRLHALGFIAGDALDTISLKKDIPMADELKEMIVDLEHALSRIQENVTQGGEIVRGLLKYSRKQDEEFSDVELDELIDDSLKMAQFKIKKDSMDVIRDFPPGLPKIKGNFAQLQEVFFNLIDNAYDAMMQRKEELKEEGYRPTIEIKAEARSNNRMNITLRDNGIGIKAEDQVKIFTPFFTTKLSSKKGTGLGLYVIQKLIEENHKGKVIYKSEYMHGTRVYVTLPVN